MKKPPEKKKKGEKKYNMAAKTPDCLEQIIDPILYRKKLVSVPDIMWGILKQ